MREHVSSVMKLMNSASLFVHVCRFSDALNSGLLEVIVPSPQYYPNFDTLQDTFGDTLERVRQDLQFQCIKCVFRLIHWLHMNCFIELIKHCIVSQHNYLTYNLALSCQKAEYINLTGKCYTI